MIGRMLVARNAPRHKVMGTIDEACAWLATDARLDAKAVAELPSVIEGLRARMG